MTCVHSEERPFLCDKCDMTFKKRTLLINHQRQLHERIRPYACDKCTRAFFWPNELKKHIQKMHEGKKEICPHCGKPYSELKEHLQRIHGDKNLNE